MTKMRWAAMGMMFLGAYVLQAFGCSSSPAGAGPGAVSGGDCCKCTITEPTCSRSQIYKPALHVNDCASFCAGQALGTCSGSATATVTVSAEGAECTEGGVVPIGSGGGGGVGGSTGNPDSGGVPAIGNLGAKCAADAQCTGGLKCLSATTDIVMGTPGSFPNGICTADCSTDLMACAPFGGLCVNFDDPNAAMPKRICLENCTLGTPADTDVKCNNRLDVACGPVSATRTACLPLCGSDADCGGRKCGAGGFCEDKARTGIPLGGVCDSNAMDPGCAGGLCLSVTDGSSEGICTGICVLGTLETCDWRRTPVAGGPPVGTCWAPLDKGGGGGDFGFCLPLCDVDGDCPKTPGTPWMCDHTIKGVDATLSHGACQPVDADAGAAPARDAGGQ